MTSTSATVGVEKATSDLLIGPDWTMNIDICDSINSGLWQAKDVVKAVKKRLQHKNPKVQFLALTLLETMIKNCGEYVHFQVADRGILQEMIKIVRKKTDMQVRDKILVLLDSWQEAFGGPGGKYPQYYWAYIELKRSGVEFPRRSPDSALIFSPPFAHTAPPPRHPQIGYGMPSNSSVRLDEAMASEMANLSLSDLDRFRSVMELLSDMLKAVNSGDLEAVKDEVIVDLVSQCRSNQKKLMQLVNSTGDEELLGHGLALNDELQSLLAKHDAIASGSSLPAEPSESIPEPTPVAPTPDSPEPTTPVTPTPVATNHYEAEEDVEEDAFAQLARRNSKYTQATQTATGANGQVVSPLNHTSETNTTTECNALALPDPPAPVKTSSKEQDMIDLLSLTLSSNPSPPHTPPSTSVPNRPPISVSPSGPGSPYTPQQPYVGNRSYIPYSSYVAPWAQPRPQLLMPQIPSSYPPPPWEATSSANANPFTTSSNQFQASAENNYTSRSYVPVHATAQPQRQYNPLGSQANSNPRQTGYGASPKPYIPANKLFEDLIDLKATDKSVRPSSAYPSLSGSPGQGVIGGRK